MDRQHFLRRAEDTPPAVVLGRFISQNAIGVARDLGRLGVPVLTVDSTSTGLRVPSRYSARALCPDPHHEEEAFLEQLLRIGRQLPRPAVLFPAGDDYVLPLAGAASDLSDDFVLPFVLGADMERVNDKGEQVDGARRAGVDAPLSVVLRSPDDLRAIARDFPFPAVLKPTTPLAGRRHLGVKVLHLKTPDQLPAAYARARRSGPLLLQEYIPGGDDGMYYLGSYLDSASRPLALFTGRRLRQYPRGSGRTRVAESVWVPEVAEAGVRLLREMNYHGISQVEFKRDPRDGRFKLIEINARHFGTHSLAAACGVNLSAIAYGDALGRPGLAPRQREGVRWWHASIDMLASVHEVWHGQMSVRDWLQPLLGVRLDGIFVPEDPLPGIADAVHTGLRLVERQARRVCSHERGSRRRAAVASPDNS